MTMLLLLPLMMPLIPARSSPRRRWSVLIPLVAVRVFVIRAGAVMALGLGARHLGDMIVMLGVLLVAWQALHPLIVLLICTHVWLRVLHFGCFARNAVALLGLSNVCSCSLPRRQPPRQGLVVLISLHLILIERHQVLPRRSLHPSSSTCFYQRFLTPGS